MKKIRLAVLGGSIKSAVGSAHFAAINLSNKFEIVAGCFSRDPDLNLKSGNHYNIEDNRIYSNFNDLIENESGVIDAILILTPTNQHKDQVIYCINKKIPVICEKAIATNFEEVIQIEKALFENNGFLVVTYNYLGYPMIRELKNLIKENYFGRINHIQIEMPQEGFIRLNSDSLPIRPQNWRLQDGKIPTISLDLGVHLHMAINYLTSESPLAVCSNQNTFGNFSNIIDNVNCLLIYTNNLTCSMWYSKVAIGKRNGMKINIYGDKKSAEWIQESPEYLTIGDQYGNILRFDRGCNDAKVSNKIRYSRFKAGHPAGFVEAFANYYEDIAESLTIYFKSKRLMLNSECFGIVESKEGINLFTAIAESSLSKKWVKLN